MEETSVILIAEDDAGHFELVKRNLWLNCTGHEILHFKDGQELLDFLFTKRSGFEEQHGRSYVLLLDIRMPKVDGREVLKKMKADDELKKIPVIMLTTTDDDTEIDRCYQLGCSFYMVKPVDYHKFMDAMNNLGAFLSSKPMRVPHIHSKPNPDYL